jgi:hypothetical protein
LNQFSRFGKVINVCMRPSANINEVLKSFFLVEMEFREQALEARKYFYNEDKDGLRRCKLGDKKAEVNVLVKTSLQGNIYSLMAPYMISYS